MDKIDKMIIDALKTKEILMKTLHQKCSWEDLPEDVKKAYMTVPVKTLANAKALWDIFGEVPINDKDEIVEEFLWFKKGTYRFDIWHWFEEYFGLSIYEDLMNGDSAEEEMENELMIPFALVWFVL